MTAKSIQIILARQLASSIATPILLVDEQNALIYYNEPAEQIFNQRFDETGEMPAAEWTTRFAAVDEDRNPIPPKDRPMGRALAESTPVSRTMWMRVTGGEWRHLHVTAIPLVGEKGLLFGAMSIFWADCDERDAMGDARLAGHARRRHGALWRNTSCVGVIGDEGTVLVLDAGTGIRGLGKTIDASVRRVDILLTHLHMDHIQGLGFFAPLFRPDLEVRIWGPVSSHISLRERLMRYLSPPLFPVSLRELPCMISLHDVPCGEAAIGEFRMTLRTGVPAGPTVGYRITDRPRQRVDLPARPRAGARRVGIPIAALRVDLGRFRWPRMPTCSFTTASTAPRNTPTCRLGTQLVQGCAGVRRALRREALRALSSRSRPHRHRHRQDDERGAGRGDTGLSRDNGAGGRDVPDLDHSR